MKPATYGHDVREPVPTAAAAVPILPPRTIGGPRPPRPYERHSAASDRGVWSVERDVRWREVDPTLAHRTPELLAALRDAAIIESYHPVNLQRLLQATWDDLDAGVVFSLELYEGFKHFHALRAYLEWVAYEPALTDEELVERRREAGGREIPPDQVVPSLVQFMLSEHLAAYFFRRLGEQAEDPVLAEMLGWIAADEVRHAQSASDLLEKRIARDPSIVPRVLEAAADFRHYGTDVVGDVPVAEPGDPVAIRTFAQRIERLCGVRLVDHLKAGLEAGPAARPAEETAAETAEETAAASAAPSAPLRRLVLPDARLGRLNFARVHEDPRLELEVLRPGPESVIVAVASGGCTVLTLLAAGAGRVEAVDLNPAQNHTVELKVAAAGLGERAAASFLGGWSAPPNSRRRHYQALKAELSPGARAYWDARRRTVEGGLLTAGTAERFLTFLRWALRLTVHPRRRMEALLDCDGVEAQRAFYIRYWDTRRWRLFTDLLLSRRAFERAYDPAFYTHVENRNFSEVLRTLFEHVATELPVDDNYFLHQALTGHYLADRPDALPPWMTRDGCRTVRASRNRLFLVDGTVTGRLRSLPDGSVTGFVLSNICEWMGPEEVDELFAQVARTAAPEARVCFRNFVGWTEVPDRWRHRVVEDRLLGEALSRRDRSLATRRFAVCTVHPEEVS